MKPRITSLEELQKAKEQLRMTSEMTRHEFAQSIGTNKAQLKDYLMKRVALPAGALGAAYGGYKMLSGSSSSKKTQSAGLIGTLLPIVINIASAFFVKEKAEKIEEEVTPPKRPVIRPELTPVA